MQTWLCPLTDWKVPLGWEGRQPPVPLWKGLLCLALGYSPSLHLLSADQGTDTETHEHPTNQSEKLNLR